MPAYLIIYRDATEHVAPVVTRHHSLIAAHDIAALITRVWPEAECVITQDASDPRIPKSLKD